MGWLRNATAAAGQAANDDADLGRPSLDNLRASISSAEENVKRLAGELRTAIGEYELAMQRFADEVNGPGSKDHGVMCEVQPMTAGFVARLIAGDSQ